MNYEQTRRQRNACRMERRRINNHGNNHFNLFTMSKITTEELQSILELHLKWLRNEEGGSRADLRDASLSYADLRGADLRDANLSCADLRGADLRDADLSCAIKVPMFCKWTHGITDGLIHIGCEKRSLEEWDKFFASEAVITTQRDTQEFKQIHAIFNAYKAYLQTLNA